MCVCMGKRHRETKKGAKLQMAVGWLQLVGFLKSQVVFAECSLFYRALLQKRPVI